MKKDVLITIKGSQSVDGESDTVEMVTTGRYYKKNNIYYLAYEETAASGFEGSRTTLKVGPNQKITMTRFGTARAQLIVEDGVRHQCQYDTGYGSMMIGVMGAAFHCDLTEEGGRIEFGYSLDIDSSVASENHVIIQINRPGKGIGESSMFEKKES